MRSSQIKLVVVLILLLANLAFPAKSLGSSQLGLDSPKNCADYFFQGTKSSSNYTLTDKGCAKKSPPSVETTINEKSKAPSSECLLFGFLHCELALIIVVVIVLLIILVLSLFKKYRSKEDKQEG